jgi:hypothetical protein
MRYVAIMALSFAFLLASLSAGAQEASEAEKATLTEIAKCMLAGLPRDWTQAEMSIDLPEPNAETGEVKYSMRRSLSGGEFERFVPCDSQKPAGALVDMRKQQPPERGGWKSARFILNRDGTFDLKYDYPPKAN